MSRLCAIVRIRTVDRRNAPWALSDNAIYTTSDGIVQLSGNPRVQQGVNMHIATSPDTVMILNQEGQLTTRGPSRTEIRQEPSPSPGGRVPVVAIFRRIGISITVAISETMTSGTLPATSPDLSKESGIGAEEVLITEQLVKIYGGRAVVNGINIKVRAGEIVGLLGPNGAGKTTSFYMIVGLVRPNSGRVIFSGTDVTNYPMHKRARLGMGYLPQEESIFRKMTVEQNILAILETLPLSKDERRKRCDQLLHQFGIERIAKNQALTLSGGEKRRLTIARSLVT